MRALKLDLFPVLGEQIDVRGANDSTTPTGRFFERNSYRLRLHALTRNSDPAAITRFSAGDFSGYDSFEASLGFLDSAPDSGTWKIKLEGGSYSSDLDHDATPAEVKAAIEALSGVGSGKVNVTAGNSANVYIIRPASASDDYTFEVSVSLVPLCVAKVRKGTDGSGSYTVIKLAKAYFATANTWTNPMPPETTVEVQSAGSSSKNTLQLIKVPVGATGSFRLSHSSVWTAPIEVAGLTPAAVASALNALYADGATSPRFAAYGTATGVQIECIGSLAKTNVPEFGIERLGQVALPTPEAVLTLDSLPLELTVAGKNKVPMVFEVTAFDADGKEHTLLQRTVDVLNAMNEATTSAAVAAVATNYVTVTTTADPEAPIQVGLRSASVTLTGSGSSGTAGDYEQTFTHNLNTLTPVFMGFRLVSTSPEKWAQLTDNEFTAETVSVNATKIYMPVIPPTSGNVGAVKFYAVNPQAAVWTNEHTHDTDEVEGTGARSGQTLTEILDDLEAAMPTDWPSVPGNILVDASVTSDKIDLADLAAALFANGEFLAALRSFGADATFIKTLVTALASSAALVTQRNELIQGLLTATAADADSQAALLAALQASPGFSEFIFAQIVTALAGGSLPPGNVFTMPSLSVLSPAPTSYTVSGKTETLYHGLPIAYQTTSDGGNVSGTLSAGTTGNRYATTAFSIAPATDYRPEQTFKTSTTLVWNGRFYQAVDVLTISGTDRYYPSEFERTVFSMFLDDARFPASTICTVAASLRTQLQSADGIRARWALVLEVGTPSSDSGATNLATFTWQTGKEHVLNIGPELSVTPIVLAVTRPASGDLTWSLSINGRASEFTLGTAVTNGQCAIRARLTKFDPENVTDPRGAVFAECINPGGQFTEI